MIETIKAAKEINVGIKNFNNSTYFVCLAFNNMESCSFKEARPSSVIVICASESNFCQNGR